MPLNIFDWSRTPLGPKEAWPLSLRAAYDIMMSSGFGMCAAWGPAKTLIYNDAYAPFLGQRHPAAVGQPLDEVWRDVWHEIGPLYERTMAGESVRLENMHLRMTRHGYPEDTYWTFSYSPLRDGNTVCGLFNVAVETTETVLAQNRARIYAERVQLALSAGAIIGTWFWDVPKDRFAVDEAFASSFGLDSALGYDGLSLEQVIATVHPDDRPELSKALKDAMERGGAYAHQYRVRRADGRYYWIEANGRVELGPDGSPQNFPGVLINVEERRAVEAERDTAIAKLRALNTDLEQKVVAQALARGRTWQVSPDMLGVLNAEGYFEASNPAWHATLGWLEEEVAGTVFFDFIHPDDQKKTRVAWEDALDRGLPALRFENRYRHKDGDWRWLSWVAVPDDMKVYCSARDITDEKRRQEELAERTAERDRLWETTNDLMGTGNLDGYLKAINPAWTTLLGWSENELLARRFHDIIDPADHAESDRAIARLAAGKDVAGFTNAILCKDGSLCHIMWAASPDPGTGLFHMVGRNVTGQRAAEETLRQAHKMEAVGQLTGGLAHDFNNLLMAVSGALELTRKFINQGRYTDVEKYIAAAQDGTKRAAALTHRLLAFSRRQTLAPRPADINQVISGMVDLIQRTVGPSIKVANVGSTGLWTAMVDVPQLENALLNLCINARDAMPDGGRITIETSNRSIDWHAARQLDLSKGQYLSLCVSDTGTGMPPEVIARAFEPFFTTKPLGEGTGLGLSMIYGFARQSGGQVRIYSEVGQGATVWIYLPRHLGKAEEDEILPVAEVLKPARQGETVLLVDDEAMVRMLIVDVLGEAGYTVLEAGDGLAGLRILQSDAQIDLLVTDVGLPGGMNGRQMADAARASRPDLKVLFITGYAENALLRNGQLETGMSILTKPFEIDTLAGRIRELIDA
ncbi:PAS domain-containing protein [Ferrovibrio terrae]|uniref:PAS domain-containing protein n=1 Tax=Ferrovibrio terrae TaxID=2594003 RepID=UPI0031380D1F